MGFGKKHDVTDIYGVKGKKASPFSTKDAPDTPESGLRHSSYYHKYFRGYTEVRKLNAKGRVVSERYYTRPWIVSGLSTRNYWLVRLLYALLVAASAALFITALCQDVPGNYSWIVALPGYPTIIALVVLAAVTVMYIFVERKMTLWGHVSSTRRLKVVSLITAIIQAVTAVDLALYALITGEEVLRSLGCAALVLLSACCSGALFFLERKMPYQEIPNDTKLPEGEAHEIW
ncbi:MAG: hypothetical protein ACI3XJ_06675 [Oscillospiraceae bacterium]